MPAPAKNLPQPLTMEEAELRILEPISTATKLVSPNSYGSAESRDDDKGYDDEQNDTFINYLHLDFKIRAAFGATWETEFQTSLLTYLYSC